MTEPIEFTDAQLNAMMTKIRRLIETAENFDAQAAEPHDCETCREGTTDHVADKAKTAANYRQKAEDLMAKYRIAEEGLISEGNAGIVPAKIEIVLLEAESEFDQYYNSLWYYIADHCGLKTFTQYVWIGTRMGLKAHAVGYAADLRYAEFLWLATRLVFSGKLEPSVNPRLSDLDNVYHLRSAGIERNRIAKLIWGAPTHANNAKVTRLYAQACAERGEDPVVAGRDMKASDYRENYARGFTYRLTYRLQAAKDAAGESNGGIVLHGRKERVEEAFYVEFPSRRPKPRVEVEDEAETGPCPRCEAAKTGECREHRTRKVTREEMRRWDRKTNGAAAVAGRRAGRTAADDVKIVQTAERSGRVAPATGPAGAIGD